MHLELIHESRRVVIDGDDVKFFRDTGIKKQCWTQGWFEKTADRRKRMRLASNWLYNRRMPKPETLKEE